MANRVDQSLVRRVMTRADTKQETSEREENAKVIAEEKPLVKAVVESVVKTAEATVPTGKESEVGKGSEESTGKGDPVADRPAGDPEPVTQDGAIGLEEEEVEVDLEGEVEFCVRKRSDGMEDLGIPPVRLGSSSRSELVREVKADPTLVLWRELADKGEQGFCWDKDLLYQSRTTHTFELIHLMVLPTSFRKRVLTMAHERSGHLGARKVKALIKQRFVWPGMGQQIMAHCRSCEVCQRCSKVKARKVPLVEREVLSEPFEVLAFGLVGPFPKGKGGYQYVLTAICMSS